jgi:multidrug efflux pump
MRIWIDPQKLIGFNLTPADVAAIAAQNAQVAGSIGDLPSRTQEITAAILVKGQLSPRRVRRHRAAANPDGSTVRIGDVARVEIGSQEYQFGTRLNGKPSTAFSVQLAPGANAWKPPPWCGRRWTSCRATSRPASIQDPLRHLAVRQSLDQQVVYTLVEAMVLVFAVMFLFLQNIRYTLIPTWWCRWR